MWSAEEGLPGDAPGLPVGVVYMFDPSNLTALPIKVSVTADVDVIHVFGVVSVMYAVDVLKYVIGVADAVDVNYVFIIVCCGIN